MELRYLTYFVAVAETMSFTKAAARCFVAQSALSQQIARLEVEVGTPLFTRTSRSVRLTAAGEVLVPLARRVLAAVADAQAELDALSGLRRGRLRLGLMASIANPVDQIAAVGDFHDQHPGIDLAVNYASSVDMAGAVQAGDLDLAIVGLAPEELPGLNSRLLAVDPLVAVMAPRHPLARRASIGVAELAGTRPFIHFFAGTGIRRYVDDAFERAGVANTHSFEVSQLGDMLRLAARDVGVTVLPTCVVTSSRTALIGTEELRVVGLNDRAAVHAVTVVYNGARLAPAASAFLAILDRYVTPS